MGQRFESLDRLARAARILRNDVDERKLLPQIRDRMILALSLADLRPGTRPLYSALERVGFSGRDGGVVVRRFDDDRELFRLLPPHRGEIASSPGCFFDPNGRFVSVVQDLQTGGTRVRVWDLATREWLADLKTTRAEYHPSRRVILFAAPEGGVAFWDVDQRQVIRRVPLHIRVSALRIDPGGRRIAVSNLGERSPRIVVFDAETGTTVADWTSGIGASSGLDWSANGRLLASGGWGNDPRIYVRDIERGTLVSVLQGHTDSVVRLRFAHQGYLLASGSYDGTTRLWDAVTGETLVAGSGLALHFTPDDRRISVLHSEGDIGISEVAAGTELLTLHPGLEGNRSESGTDGRLLDVRTSPDGRVLAISDTSNVILWETERGRELARLDAGPCHTVLFQPDGRAVVTFSERGIFRWPICDDLAQGRDALRIGPPELLREARGGEYFATWMPDGTTLAVVEHETARALLLNTARQHLAWIEVPTLESGGAYHLRSVSVSPDGRYVAVGGWKTEGIYVWQLPEGRLVQILRPQNLEAESRAQVAFSPDGSRLVGSYFGNSYQSWRVATWAAEPERLIKVERSAVNYRAPAFSRDGRLRALLIAPDQVQLAEPDTGRELARLTTLQPISPSPVTFSPDGTKLFAVTARHTALIWDLRHIREQLALHGLDWDAPPYPKAATSAEEVTGAIPPPRSVRVIGAALEPEARRNAERAEMDRRLAANPDDTEARIHRGWLAIAEGRAADASRDLDRPSLWSNTDVERMLYAALERMNDLPDLQRILDRQLGLNPNDTDARYRRGLIGLELGHFASAAEDFDAVLAARPQFDHARYTRIQALVRIGRDREAVAEIDAVLPKYSQDWVLYHFRAIARANLGESEQSRADAQKARTLLPRDPGTLNHDAWRHVTRPLGGRDPERGVGEGQRLVELAPGHREFLNTLAVALYRTARFAEAATVLQRCLAIGRGEREAFDRLFLAMAHSRLGHRAQAREEFDQAIQWIQTHKDLGPGHVTELAAFRAEAEAILHASDDELPADVFVHH
jgi:WD40 repeat protein/Flp pilus assembly protein TadD